MSFSLRLSSLEKRLNPPGSSAAAIEQQPCGICGRQFAKYTCPTCNTPYCSLTCFRSEAHAQCTEPFYRQALEDEIKSGPSRTAEEKRAMLEMLKRFEEQSAELDEGGDSDAEEEEGAGDELANKLAGLDLDTADPEELWDALTPEQQAEFTRLLQDPESESARALLASASAQEDPVLPWWEATLEDEEDGKEGGGRYAHPPGMMDVPEGLVQLQRARQGPLLVYNVIAIALVYSYATRHMGRSPLSSPSPGPSAPNPRPDTAQAESETAELILRTLPFLADRRSTLVFPSVESALTDVWSRLPQQDAGPALFAVLLEDAAALLRPRMVSELEVELPAAPPPQPSLKAKPTTQSAAESSSPPATAASSDARTHPNRMALLMLSDLYALLWSHKPAAMKLQYYAAHVLSLPPRVLEEVCAQAALASQQQQEEEERRLAGGGGQGTVSTLAKGMV
ncbi:hypothetical protein CALVIDRAFT_559595 [Calocera viscosa TUFC12733]|uniref:HIT-type domain-containing protein n=1 Tax=Calocera viscosa (strain TUFC12733) TaxID=1330018 RepID=A0A167SD38_CALVF|nr:hypothetical protein CALVIDRAFT_559595 [Calocera viscosa TUFC12733]